MKPMKPDRTPSASATTPNTPSPNGSRSPSASTTRSDGEQSDRNQEDKSKVPCKFFAKTYKGCARAGRCPFLHSWEGVEKNGRCLACGGKNHSAKECPHKKPAPPGEQSAAANTSGKPQGPKSPIRHLLQRMELPIRMFALMKPHRSSPSLLGPRQQRRLRLRPMT